MEVIENGVHAQVYKPCLHVEAKVSPKPLSSDRWVKCRQSRLICASISKCVASALLLFKKCIYFLKTNC